VQSRGGPPFSNNRGRPAEVGRRPNTLGC